MNNHGIIPIFVPTFVQVCHQARQKTHNTEAFNHKNKVRGNE